MTYPHTYFPSSYFPGRYFPPLADAEQGADLLAPYLFYGAGYGVWDDVIDVDHPTPHTLTDVQGEQAALIILAMLAA